MDATETSKNTQLALQALLQGLSDLGFGTDGREIAGADAVEAIGMLVADVRRRQLPSTDIVAYVVGHGSEKDAFLTHDEDWGDRDQAKVFFTTGGAPHQALHNDLGVSNLRFLDPDDLSPIEGVEQAIEPLVDPDDPFWDEDAMAQFMLERIESGSMKLEDIPLRLARYGLMEPGAFVAEMRERQDSYEANTSDEDGDAEDAGGSAQPN